MQIQFKGTHYELTEEEKDFITKKMKSLGKFLGSSKEEASAYVTCGKHTEGHKKGDVWFAECNLDVEGKRFVARAEADTLRSATDTMSGELGRELRVAKRKKQSLFRRGGSHIKNLLRFGK